MDFNKKILFIVGPTASGKTGLSLGLANFFSSEIVSADSMQVYQGMDIGTAKVSPAIQKKIPHHLIDILLPNEKFSAFDYRERALTAISEIHKKNKLPIVVGGSGLYIKALFEGIAPFSKGSDSVRLAMKNEIAKNGLDSLYDKLRSIDPERAEQINSNDERRIIRALEINAIDKIKPSQKGNEKTSLAQLGYSVYFIGITQCREFLYDRVNKRVDEMLDAGLVSEVEKLKNMFSLTTLQAVGYKEILGYLKGDLLLEEAVSKIKQNTRHLVKKQLTWFRRETNIDWLNIDMYSTEEELVLDAVVRIKKWLR